MKRWNEMRQREKNFKSNVESSDKLKKYADTVINFPANTLSRKLDDSIHQNILRSFYTLWNIESIARNRLRTVKEVHLLSDLLNKIFDFSIFIDLTGNYFR